MIQIGRFVEPSLLLRILEAMAVAMALILICLILLLVLQKLVLERRSRAIDAAAEAYARALAAGTRVEELVVDPRSAIERKALGRALAGHAERLGHAALRAAPWFGALVEHLEDDARHRDWGERVVALELLGELGAVEARPFLERAARREARPEAYAACLGSLARFADQPPALAALWQCVHDRPPLSGSFNEGLFRTAIAAHRRGGGAPGAAAAFRAMLSGADAHDALTLNAISAVGKSGLADLVPDLAAAYARAQAPKEFRIACVRAVGMLQADHAVLLGALDDPDWEVRAVAARYLRSSAPEAVERLSACLGSPAFYVRYNAARTLAELGAQGRAVLERTLDASDAFARDISRYALSVPQHGSG